MIARLYTVLLINKKTIYSCNSKAHAYNGKWGGYWAHKQHKINSGNRPLAPLPPLPPLRP